MTPDLLGWTSAAVLIATIGSQIIRQCRARTSAGVSPWLFVGQFTASSGLLVYSAMLADPIFVVLNGCMAAAALVGLGVWRRYQRLDEAQERTR